jgi:hypothetical protein
MKTYSANMIVATVSSTPCKSDLDFGHKKAGEEAGADTREDTREESRTEAREDSKDGKEAGEEDGKEAQEAQLKELQKKRGWSTCPSDSFSLWPYHDPVEFLLMPFCPISTIANFAATNRKWRARLNSDSFWQRMLARDFIQLVRIRLYKSSRAKKVEKSLFVFCFVLFFQKPASIEWWILAARKVELLLNLNIQPTQRVSELTPTELMDWARITLHDKFRRQALKSIPLHSDTRLQDLFACPPRFACEMRLLAYAKQTALRNAVCNITIYLFC